MLFVQFSFFLFFFKKEGETTNPSIKQKKSTHCWKLLKLLFSSSAHTKHFFPWVNTTTTSAIFFQLLWFLLLCYCELSWMLKGVPLQPGVWQPPPCAAASREFLGNCWSSVCWQHWMVEWAVEVGWEEVLCFVLGQLEDVHMVTNI